MKILSKRHDLRRNADATRCDVKKEKILSHIQREYDAKQTYTCSCNQRKDVIFQFIFIY